MVYDEVAGADFPYDEGQHLEIFIPILESSYEIFTTNLILYHATGNENVVIDINKELQKYGL